MYNHYLSYLQKKDYVKYLCTKTAPTEEAENFLLAFFELDEEIAQIAFASSNPLINLMRIMWWRDEINLKHSSHHLLKTLLQDFYATEEERESIKHNLLKILDLTEIIINQNEFNSEALLLEKYLFVLSAAQFDIISVALKNLDSYDKDIYLIYSLLRFVRSLELYKIHGLFPKYSLHNMQASLCREAREKINNLKRPTHKFMKLIYTEINFFIKYYKFLTDNPASKTKPNLGWLKIKIIFVYWFANFFY